MKPEQNGCHFAEDIFKCIFSKENLYISIQSIFIIVDLIDNESPLVQVNVCPQTDYKPWPELVMT